MPKRLSERFRPGDHVEICFLTEGREKWLAGIVVAEQTPGLWVQDDSGRKWYVTNGRRIRPLPELRNGL